MKWISTLLITLSIVASVLTIRPARAEAPLPPKDPSKEQIEPANELLPPILQKIAYCESGNRQFTASGALVLGRVNPDDWGRFQVNVKAHGAEAQKLGDDLRTWEGNTAFAIWLFQREGTAPWIYSRSCWAAK